MNLKDHYVVDVESDGPIPGFMHYSMICFGAVNVETKESFYGRTKPISPNFLDSALEISGFTRDEHDEFDEPADVMEQFYNWLTNNGKYKNRIIFWSDNLAFDWQWINWYFHQYMGENPFGYSGRRINDLYCGIVGDIRLSNEWKKKYRVTKHDHNPVNDAMGNVEALRTILSMLKKK